MPGLGRKKKVEVKVPESPEALFRSDPEDSTPSGYPRLTRELLDWAITALTALLSTSEIRDEQAFASSIRHTLKRLDHLFPLVLKGEARAKEVAEAKAEIEKVLGGAKPK